MACCGGRNLLDEAPPDGPDCGLGSVVGIDLAKNVLDMFFDSLNANTQGAADFSIAETQGHVPQDL